MEPENLDVWWNYTNSKCVLEAERNKLLYGSSFLIILTTKKVIDLVQNSLKLNQDQNKK